MDIGYILRSTRHEMQSRLRARPALSMGDGPTLTYGELDELSCSYANGLLSLGVKPGDRVALLMNNSIDYVALYLAITSIGAVAVRVNFRLGADELTFVLDDSQASILIADGIFLDVISTMHQRVKTSTFVFLDGDQPEWAVDRVTLDAASTEPPTVQIPGPEDPAMLMYTSGTTGHFKGVLWTHAATMWHAALQALHYGFTEDTVAMTTGPLYHIGALENMLSPCLFMHGHGVISPSRSFQTMSALRTIEHHRVTDIFMFSFMLAEMLQSHETQTIDLSSLRRLVAGGTGIPTWAAEQVAVQLPHARLELAYGMTETGTTTTTAGGLTEEMSVDYVGTMVPGFEIVVVDDDGTPVAKGVEGEILTRGPAVTRGYWNLPIDSALVFTDGWCRSGDLGVVDDLGRLRLSGRSKDLVRTGGENVHPGEVESVLMGHPDVTDVAVIGIPDTRLNEAVCALVVLREGSDVDADDLITYVKSRIASFKKPRHVEFVDSLPRNASGKLLKHLLREHYAHLGS